MHFDKCKRRQSKQLTALFRQEDNNYV